MEESHTKPATHRSVAAMLCRPVRPAPESARGCSWRPPCRRRCRKARGCSTPVLLPPAGGPGGSPATGAGWVELCGEGGQDGKQVRSQLELTEGCCPDMTERLFSSYHVTHNSSFCQV